MNTSLGLGNVSDLDSYTNLSGLATLKTDSRKNSHDTLEEVAKQFESVFLNMMMKSMRDANQTFSEGGLFDSQQSRMYRDMFDNQLSLSLSKGQGIGLARSIVSQLEPYVQAQTERPSQVDIEI